VKEKRINEIKGLILFAAGLIILASLVSFTPFDLSFYTSHPNFPAKNFIRTFGAYFAGLLFFLFGWASYAIPALVLFIAVKLFKQEKPDLRIPRFVGILVLLLSLSSLIATFSLKSAGMKFSHAGYLGYVVSIFMTNYFGKLGASVLFITLIILSVALVTDILISAFFSGIINRVKPIFKGLLKFKLKPRIKERQAAEPVRPPKNLSPEPSAKLKIIDGAFPKPATPLKPNIQLKPVKLQAVPSAEAKVRPAELKIGDYNLPTVDLLDSPPPFEARQIKDDLEANARILEETLEDFGISVKVTDIERGPVITRYELEPAPGVKLNRIVALGDDIALAMKAQSVRIVAPIPGKARVGVEVPNSQSSLVYLKELLVSSEFQKAKSKLTLALGKDIAGYPVVADLGDMPHLLIAGTTGAGKTVCVNTLILSMLYRCSPNDLKFLMVDPKMVELAPFNGLPHLLCPVVTDAKKAAIALSWVVGEMEERYQLLAKASARNIDAYNEKQEKIPYIIVIIDEMADLMMVSRDQIESAITRLAQLSRAVGIHLIMATQRPSVDVITGVIKANFPARISFKVASKVDSRTVLDMNGADKLLGKGDMLFLKPGEAKLTRAQGSLVNDKEIERVVDFIKAQAEPVYDEEILKDSHKSGLGSGEKDEMYDEAVRVIMESNQASVSILQRRLRFGYTRAARIIDTMEQEGLVGPFEGSKPRRILVDREAWMRSQVMPLEEER
jgi:DNA segregation ATPase FtsK/SpoIIIE, S-DNA-T family